MLCQSYFFFYNPISHVAISKHQPCSDYRIQYGWPRWRHHDTMYMYMYIEISMTADCQ